MTSQETLKSLVGQRLSLYSLQEVQEFGTWWSKNLATVINGDYSYTLWVVIYEPAYGKVSENLKKIEVISGYDDKYDLQNTKWRATEISIQLNGRNPILYIHPNANSCAYFNNIVKESYVVKVDLPCKWVKACETIRVPIDINNPYSSINYKTIEVDKKIPNQNPSNYLRPLDIVKVARSALGNKFYHFGVYLGNNKVCHYSDPNSKVKTDNNRIRITSWEIFVGECFGCEIIGYHTVIPFRHYEEIVQNIAWDEANSYGNSRYCLANHNCEHYVNFRILGLNYSKQVAERPSKSLGWAHSFSNYEKCLNCKINVVNDGEDGDFNLRYGLEIRNQNLNKTNNYCSQGIERQYLQEVPSKQNCRIM